MTDNKHWALKAKQIEQIAQKVMELPGQDFEITFPKVAHAEFVTQVNSLLSLLCVPIRVECLTSRGDELWIKAVRTQDFAPVWRKKKA